MLENNDVIFKEDVEILKLKAEIKHPNKSRSHIFFLSLVGGWFGLHRFHLKNYVIGGMILTAFLSFFLASVYINPFYMIGFFGLVFLGIFDGLITVKKVSDENELNKLKRFEYVKNEIKGKKIDNHIDGVYAISIEITKTYFDKKKKSKAISSFIAFFFGGLGFQRFYLGEINKGFVILALFTTLQVISEYIYNTGTLFSNISQVLFPIIVFGIYIRELMLSNHLVNLKNKEVNIELIKELMRKKEKRLKNQVVIEEKQDFEIVNE